jgi:PAS domain S-box-containing protein
VVRAATLEDAARAALEAAAESAFAVEAWLWIASPHGRSVVFSWNPVHGLRQSPPVPPEHFLEERHRRCVSGETFVERDPLRNRRWTFLPVPGPDRALGALAVCQEPGAAAMGPHVAALAATLGLKSAHLGSAKDLENERDRAAGWFKTMDAQIRILEGERQKLAALLSGTDAAVLVLDPQGTVLWANPVMASRLGHPNPSALAGTSCRILCGGAARCEDCPVRQVAERNELVHQERRETRGDEVRHHYVSAYPVRTPEGTVREILVMMQDLTDLETLRRSEARYHLLFERSADAMVMADPRTLRILSANRQARLLLGADPSGARAPALVDLHPAGVRADMERRYVELAHGRPLENVEVEVLDAKGRVLTCNACGTLFDLRGTEVVLLEYRDVTQVRQLQRELARADHLIALGTMNAGIAHEFKNRLAPLRAFGQLVSRKEPSPELIARHGPLLVGEVDRLAGLVRDILDYARPPEPRSETADLVALVRAMGQEFSREFSPMFQERGIRFHVAAGSLEPLPVLVDADQLRNVLFNLVQNGADALAGPDGSLEVSVVRSGDRALVLVRDSGHGIDEANLHRIFEPFFSTKGTRGTGLGMCIVKSLVEANRGRIDLASAPGQGTTVTLSFPIAHGDGARRAA